VGADTDSGSPLHDRVVVVTGASKGIGKATALALAAAGGAGWARGQGCGWARGSGVGDWTTVRAVLPTMLAQGSGHIVTVSSVYGRKGSPGFAAYCASKYAVIGLSESLALEVKSQGVKVTVVEPGTVDTGFRDGMTNRPITGLLAHPEKMLTPADVASAIVWALSSSPTAVPDEIRLDTARW